jgi:hypothetical protein
MGWAFAALEARGFRYDSSIFPARSLIYGDPGAPRAPFRVPGCALAEFPIMTLRAAGRNWPAGGGFYTRVLPTGVARLAVRQANAAGAPAVLYVHPWELDTGQRLWLHATPRERVTHYWGRGGLAGRLRALLSEFRFGALEDVLEEWKG